MEEHSHNRGIRRQAMVVALSSLLAVSGHAFKFDGKLDGPLRTAVQNIDQKGKSDVIFKTDGPLTKAQKTELAALGVKLKREFKVISSYSATLPKRNLDEFAALSFVKHVSLDGVVKKSDAFTINSSLAIDAWGNNGGKSGSGVTIAIVDSGIQPHVDMDKGKIKANVNFSSGMSVKLDDCGHGTHVAGIAAGTAKAGKDDGRYTNMYGIARGADLVGVRVLDGRGSGTVSDVLAGIQWVIQNRQKYNIKVMNLSLGHPVGESYVDDPLCQAVKEAWGSGIVVVCAAGNAGRMFPVQAHGQSNEGWGTNYGSINSPGNSPYVITVGATKSMDTMTRDDDRIATYSSRGPSRLDFVMKPDIVTGGNKVWSTMYNTSFLFLTYFLNTISTTGMPLNMLGKDYFVLSGTSMAAPVVSGAAAMLIQNNPDISPDTVKMRLMLTADKWAAPDGTPNVLTYGAGCLNIPAALNSNVVATQPAMSPTLVFDENGFIGLNGEWLGANRAIWGSNVNDLRAIWGSGFNPDGFTLLDANRAMWGSSVWADRAMWGSSTGAVDLSSVAITGEQ